MSVYMTLLYVCNKMKYSNAQFLLYLVTLQLFLSRASEQVNDAEDAPSYPAAAVF
jgi:hypothetical protein